MKTTQTHSIEEHTVAEKIDRLSKKVAKGQRTFGNADLDLIQALCIEAHGRRIRAEAYGA